MRNALAIALALLACAAGPARAAESPPADVPACPSGSDNPDVAALVRRTEKLLQGSSTVGTFSMTIKTKTWSRTLKLKTWSKGRDYTLVRVLDGGPRETGMLTLKREKQLWNYLPQAGRVMKLPAGMLGDNWMGSDFTNDDLVRGSSLTEDFDSKVLGVEKAGGRDAWKVRLMPRPESAAIWGKVEMLIDRSSCLPVSQDFFDDDGKLARRLEYGDFRQVGWRQFPARMTVTPSEPGRQTSIVYDDIEFDVAIPDDTFGLHRLRQGR